MRRDRSPAQWADIAAACRAAGLLDHAVYLQPKDTGRPCVERGPSGETVNAEGLADLWVRIRDRIAELGDEAEALASFESPTYSEDFLANLWRLEGRDDVRRVLRSRGEIKPP